MKTLAIVRVERKQTALRRVAPVHPLLRGAVAVATEADQRPEPDDLYEQPNQWDEMSRGDGQ